MYDRKPRLLVIDDDAQVLRVFHRALGRDFKVDSHTDPVEPLRRVLGSDPYDAILCDRNLPGGMSGQRFYEAVPDVVQARIVMCSGSDFDLDDPFALVLGDRFILKPMAMTDLAAVLLRVARGSSLAA
ncbi:MAG: sensor hybrid histidine kinase [Myxococcaceae bacterium]|nr:sensor hybrid histidine kinase [Myxococcaceae bacterium]MEA2747548.1 hypothetical protein [Myxococcales bacterium]